MDLRPCIENEPQTHEFSNLNESDRLLLCEVMRRRINRVTSGKITDEGMNDVKYAAKYIDNIRQGITNATTFNWEFITEIMEVTSNYVDDLAVISKQLGSVAYGAISDRVRIQEAGMAAVELFKNSEIVI